MTLLLATRNAHKVREFATLLAPHGVDPLPDEVELPPETGATFAENALGKARAAAAATGRVAIADDSGIEAQALGGAPGRALRPLRRRARDRRRRTSQLLLREAPAGSALRLRLRARVRRSRRRGARRSRAAATGRLTRDVRGDGGFGYDPAFVPDDDAPGRTMAELTAAEKDAISHRGRAVRELQAWLASR